MGCSEEGVNGASGRGHGPGAYGAILHHKLHIGPLRRRHVDGVPVGVFRRSRARSNALGAPGIDALS